MTEYVLLLPGDEDSWADAAPERRRETYARHLEFQRLLTERGHRLRGGAELTHSKTATVVRGSIDEVTITDGPYAETVEQLSGFYLVESEDLPGLQQLCGLLAGTGAVEIRAVVPDSDPSVDSGKAAQK